MIEALSLVKYVVFQSLGLVIIVGVAGLLIYFDLKKACRPRTAFLIPALLFLGIFLFYFAPRVLPQTISYPLIAQTYGPGESPILPLKNVLTFFKNLSSMERVVDIAGNPNEVPPTIGDREPAVVEVALVTKEVISEIAPGIFYNYWTFDGQVPGPMIRVKEGDTVRLTLTNDPSSLHHHNIDLHAVTGPGGGAVLTNVAPGESKTMTFTALHPGLFVYHCAHPNVPSHMTHGLYGLILVEPKDGLPPVDKEFYVMQGEFYTANKIGSRGLQVFDGQKMMDGKPEYVVFNGKTGALTAGVMEANKGDTVRIYFGNGGVNQISSFHLIGEVFDTVYPEASMGGALLKNVQTTLVPAGGATIVEFDVQVPGNYVLVDHALARVDRGAWGILSVSGEQDAETKKIFDGIVDPHATGH